MNFGQIKYFKIEKLKWSPCFVLMTIYSITKDIDNHMKRQVVNRVNINLISGEDDISYYLCLLEKMCRIYVDLLMRYL